MLPTKDYATLDYAAEVKRYDPAPDTKAIEAIKRYVGIALQKRDSALVACGDPKERERIAANFLKKKLGLDGDAASLDKHVQEICQLMKADKDKLRVTFYYLLAQKHGKLASFT